MKRSILQRVVVTALSILPLSLASAGDKTYRLGKQPEYKVGQTLSVSKTQEMEFVAKARGQASERQESTEFELELVVLEVDDDHLPTRLRMNIASASGFYKASDPRFHREEPRKTQLKNIWLELARSEHGRYLPVWPSLKSAKALSLTAPQFQLLRDVVQEVDRLPSLPSERYLLPDKPVAVGDRWSPSKKRQAQWVREGDVPVADPNGVSMKLKSVDDEGIATVEGRLGLIIKPGGASIPLTGHLLARIDTNTGRWVSQSITSNDTSTFRGAEITYQARESKATSSRAGNGKVPRLPSKLNDIGFEYSQKDTNNYRDVMTGISLYVPDDYKQVKHNPNSDQIALFRNRSGMQIAVTRSDLLVPTESDELLKALRKNLRSSIDDYKIIEEDAMMIASGVPATFIEAKGFDGTVWIYTLVAFAGDQMYSISTAAPIDSPKIATEMRTVARSLRIYSPGDPRLRKKDKDEDE